MKNCNLKVFSSYFTICIILLCSLYSDAYGSKRRHHESYYQERWCERSKGQQEFVLPDRTRADCITDTLVVEVDFANKAWSEGIGQVLYYSLVTDKQAMLVIICEDPKDLKYIDRIINIISYYDLDILIEVVRP